MYQKLRKLTQKLAGQFDRIPAERKAILQKIADYIQPKYDQNSPISLVFICTHNSRRSHFGQIAAALAANYYSVDNVQVFSGGTEATAFHPNAIKALRKLGFDIDSEDETVKNPVWTVRFGVQNTTTCFSKTFDDVANPTKGFAAIMTCSDAEQNCPFVPGTELRIGTTYKDPKASDGTPEQDQTYQERFQQIATEMLYTFSLIQ
jgi:protein-tyrosine phosphatase/arsenate reductase